jgi:DNA-binding MarR family transcriptional regulator
VASSRAPRAGGTLTDNSPAGTTHADDATNQLRLVLLRLARQIRSNSLSEITPSQLAVLATLARHGPCTVGQVAEHERIRAPSASKLLAGLEARNLAERHSDPEDRRRSLIALSPEGRDFLAQVRAAGESWLSARLAELDDEQRAVLEQAVPILEQLLGSSE